jgi:hypothetical protein
MKFRGLASLVFLLSLGLARAQVTVEVTLPQDQFLQGESLPVAVRIVNRSGQTLRLGEGQDWLAFSLEGREGQAVPKLGDVPVEGEFLLESSQVAIKHVDLAPYFSLSGPGRFGVVAAVKIKDWGHQVESLPKYFDIVDGSKLWEQVVGIPEGADKTSTMPEVRRYILQQANYIKGQLRLYLRVTDSTGRAIRVFNLGPMLSFSRPEPQVDKLSHLHVLYQKGPGSYSYTVFDLDGKVLIHQTYEYLTTRPRLKLDDDGSVSVTGGSRKVGANDVPPPTPEELEQAAKQAEQPAAPAPAQTQTNSAKGKKK